MEAYPAEVRQEVLAACDAGELTHDVALRFGVSKAWVRRIKQQRRETGQVEPRKSRNRRYSWEAWADWLRAKVAARPDIYLHELQTALEQEHGVHVCLQTMANACRALGLSRKKRLS